MRMRMAYKMWSRRIQSSWCVSNIWYTYYNKCNGDVASRHTSLLWSILPSQSSYLPSADKARSPDINGRSARYLLTGKPGVQSDSYYLNEVSIGESLDMPSATTSAFSLGRGTRLVDNYGAMRHLPTRWRARWSIMWSVNIKPQRVIGQGKKSASPISRPDLGGR